MSDLVKRIADEIEKYHDVGAYIVSQNRDKLEQAAIRRELLGWFVGQAMKALNGEGVPELLLVMFEGQCERLRAEKAEAEVARLTTLAQEGRKWQPMETAPKDGSKFLGLTSAGDCAIVSRHDPGGEKRNPKHHYETWVCDFNSALVEPTHWMALPQPPALTREPGEGK